MDVIKLLEYLQEMVEDSAKVPITGKVLINKREFMETIDQIINYLPDEFKKAQWICEEKERMIREAVEESENIKKQNIAVLKKQIENHNITEEAKIRAEDIIASAQRDAKIIRTGARNYADEILSQLEKEINSKGKQMVTNVKHEVQDLVGSLEEQVNITTNTIRDNIKELRNFKK